MESIITTLCYSHIDYLGRLLSPHTRSFTVNSGDQDQVLHKNN